MPKDTLNLSETLEAPNSFSAGVRFAEELTRMRMRAVSARIVAALVEIEANPSKSTVLLRSLVEELRNDLVVSEIPIEVGEATAAEAPP